MGFNQILSTPQDSRTFSQVRTSKMKATVTAAALIGIFLLAGVSDTFASPRAWGYHPAPPAPLCECINAYLSILTCRDAGWCYVACDGACRDQQQTASTARCQSTAACCVHRGECGAFTA